MRQPVVLIGAFLEHRRLRAWAFDADGEVVAHHVAALDASGSVDECCVQTRFHLNEWLGEAPAVPVIAAGFARYSGGMDVPGLLPVPVRIEEIPNHLVLHHGLNLVPGLRQNSPPDYVCGQEVMLGGLDDPGELVCIPGQHSLHLTIEHGRILDVSTELTLQIRDAVLRAERAWKPAMAQAFDRAVFCEWLERSLDPDDAASPFAAEAACVAGLLKDCHYACALDGLMIGAEISAHYEPGDDVCLIADGALAETYALALEALDVDVTIYGAEESLKDGLFEMADLAGLLEDE